MFAPMRPSPIIPSCIFVLLWFPSCFLPIRGDQAFPTDDSHAVLTVVEQRGLLEDTNKSFLAAGNLTRQALQPGERCASLTTSFASQSPCRGASGPGHFSAPPEDWTYSLAHYGNCAAIFNTSRADKQYKSRRENEMSGISFPTQTRHATINRGRADEERTRPPSQPVEGSKPVTLFVRFLRPEEIKDGNVRAA